MIDLTQYKKIAEFRDGNLYWLTDDIENIVYVMVFGEDFYVGSTQNIRRRYSQYVPALKRGNYDAKPLQAAFDREGKFDVYLLENPPLNILRDRENYYLQELQPTLNTRKHASMLFADIPVNPVLMAKFGVKPKRRKKISKQNHVKNVCKNTEGDIIKGVQTYIPIPDYLRLCRLKTLRRETISDMFAQAIRWYLDKCEGKI